MWGEISWSPSGSAFRHNKSSLRNSINSYTEYGTLESTFNNCHGWTICGFMSDMLSAWHPNHFLQRIQELHNAYMKQVLNNWLWNFTSTTEHNIKKLRTININTSINVYEFLTVSARSRMPRFIIDDGEWTHLPFHDEKFLST